jgi:hypothetical protein
MFYKSPETNTLLEFLVIFKFLISTNHNSIKLRNVFLNRSEDVIISMLLNLFITEHSVFTLVCYCELVFIIGRGGEGDGTV